MRVLFLPNNLASLPKITAVALNKIADIHAVVYSNSSHKYLNNQEVIFFDIPSFRSRPFFYIIQRWKQFKTLLIEIYKADVLHWGANILNPSWFWIFYINILRKPGIIEFYGSDIRDPIKLSQINPFYKNEIENGEYEYANFESKENSIYQQKCFSKMNFLCYSAAEMFLYIDKSLFKRNDIIYQRMDLTKYIPHIPDKSKTELTIIHMPSAKGAKGSKYVEQVIQNLKKEFIFEYKTVHNVSKEEADAALRSADIFVDQFIGGSYGLASCEAMALGKPVICYVMPEVYNEGLSPECPIISASIETLESEITKILQNPNLCNEIGIKSRAFVEKYHDADKIAPQLVEIYKQAIELKRGKSNTVGGFRSLLSDSAIYGSALVFNRILNVLLVPFYAHVFSAADYGKSAIAINTYQIINVFLILALDNSTALFFYKDENLQSRKTVFSTWFWTSFGLSIFAAILLVIVSPLLASGFFENTNDKFLFWIIAINLPLSVLANVFTNWLRFQRFAKQAAIVNISATLFLIGANIFFIRYLKIGISGILLGYTFSFLTTGLLGLYYMLPYLNIKLYNKVLIKEMLHFAKPLIPAGIAYWFLNSAGVFFLEKYSTKTEIGIYQMAANLSQAMFLITGSFQMAWGPYALSIQHETNAKETFARVLLLFTFISCVASIFISIFSKEILTLVATKEYYDSHAIIGPLALNFIVIAIGYIANIGLIIKEKSKPFGMIIIVSAIVSVFSYWILIPRFGKEGVVLTTLVAQFIVPIYLFYKANEVYPIRYDFIKVITLLAICFGFAFFNFIVKWEICLNNIFIKTGIFFGICLVFMFIIKNEISQLSNLKLRKV